LESPRNPFLKIGDVLIASIQIALDNADDAAAVQFRDDLFQRIYDMKARGLIIDLTAVDDVDSFVGRVICDIVSMTGLMGMRVLIIGMQPAITSTLVGLGLELPRVLTAPNLEKGLAALRRQSEENSYGAG
jgi:rsbT antagonist protein RsbS